MNNWLSKYQFNDEWALWLLLIIPISIAYYIWFNKEKNEPLKISSIDLFQGIESKYTKWTSHYTKFKSVYVI